MVRTHERASVSSARRASDDPGEVAAVPPTQLPAGAFRPRAVGPSDRELLRRVLRVPVTAEFTARDSLSTSARRRRGGWALERHTAGFDVLSRRWATWGAGGPPVLATVATGTLPCAVEQLARLLRAPGESEMNALLRGTFGPRAIYGSLLHLVSGRDRRALLPSTHADAQLAVRCATFAHSRLASLLPAARSEARADSPRRNDQLCFAEYVEPTPSGFVVRYCSLPAHELRAGVAPPECVAQLHPFTGWLVAERDGARVRVTFRATFHGAEGGGCSTKRAAKWMARAAAAVTRLGDVVRTAFREPDGRASSSKATATTAAAAGDRRERAGHRNWHCIACTRSLVGVFRRAWRRCDLCAYSVCADSCCSLGQVAIYNRYVAPLLVCRRCRECMDDPDPPSRASSQASPSMWAISTRAGGREDTAGGRRRALSDPPFVPTLELTSSGEDHSSSS